MSKLEDAGVSRASRSASLAASLTSALVAAFVVAGKALRDALFCTHFAASELPAVMLSGAVVTALLALLGARLFRARGPVFGVAALLLANAVLLSIEYGGFASAPRVTALLVYWQVSGVAAVLASGFWLAVNERFDAHTLRLIVNRIGAGGSLGGLAGGAGLQAVTAWQGPSRALIALAILSIAAAFSIRTLQTQPTHAPLTGAATPVRQGQSSYVRLIAVFLGLTALTSSLADFAFKARAMEHFAGATELVRFFAVFYAAANVLSFAIQSLLTPRLLEKTDLGFALGTLPGALAISALVTLVLPGWSAQAVLKGTDAALGTSLFRSAYEPLFTPLALPVKRSVKAVIDVVVDKLGDASGSAFAWGLVWLVPAVAARGASFAVVLLSLGTLVLAGRLYQRYVEELGASLRAGAVVLDDSHVDRTTRLTLSRTLEAMTRERLLVEIQKRAAEARPPRASEPPALLDSDPRATHAVLEQPARAGELAGKVKDLAAGDPERVERALQVPDARLSAFVIPLLERRELATRAMSVLAALVPRISGQLADALLDRERSSPAVRRRLARVLARGSTPWAAAGLLAALDDPDTGVRNEVVKGLDGMRRAGVALPVTRESLLGRAHSELERFDAERNGAVEQVFLLLGLAFEPEAFRLAARAIASPDEKLRGTALEYVENVVPEPLRSALLSRLTPRAARKSTRREGELLAELTRSIGPAG